MIQVKRDLPVLVRLLILMVLLAAPLGIGLLFTFDVIKIEWISSMEIQPSYRSQEDPLPLPPRSVPVQGVAYLPELGEPVNPQVADAESLQRGEALYNSACVACHGRDGQAKTTVVTYLVQKPPANLVAADANARTLSDGAIFIIITEGVGKMPSLRENLPTAQMRWDVVNYVRKLQGK
jgi:mono/diheme cytochrome c family protein